MGIEFSSVSNFLSLQTTTESNSEINNNCCELPAFPFGFRDPLTAVGSWDGAFVAGYDHPWSSKITAAFFDDGMDFIGHPSLSELKATVEELKQKGWTPMERYDIWSTAYVF